MKKRIIGTLFEKGGMPTEALPSECGVEFTLGRSVSVCGCEGIIRFCENEAVIKVKCGLLGVEGKAISLQSFGCGNIRLTGKITNVKLL